MVDVIEISEESKEPENETVNHPEPEFYNLEDSLTFNGYNQTNYPSSPQRASQKQEAHVEIIESNPASSEVSVPFCHDLSTSRDNETMTFNASNPVDKSAGKAKGEKLLDKIIDIFSSPNSSLTSEKMHGASTVPLKKMAANGPMSQNSKSTRFFDLSDDNLKMQTSEMVPSKTSQDILAEYPLSSPVVDPLSNSEVAEGDAIMQSSDHFFSNAKRQEFPSTKQQFHFVHTEIEKGTIEPKLQKVHKSKERGIRSGSLRPDVINLNISKFIKDKNDERTYSLSAGNLKPGKKIKIAPTHTISSNLYLENVKLQQYISRSKHYSHQESNALLRYWQEKDKKTFKRANQIHRSNENARSSIILEMSSKLLSSFQKNKSEIETIISPATLQIGYDNELPKIRFLRRSTSVYDLDHDIYYPSELKLLEENINLLFYDALTFFELYRSQKKSLYDAIQSFSKNNKYLIVVLSDVNKLKKSMESLEDRQYKQKVQEQLTGSQQASSHNKKVEAIKNLQMSAFDLEQRLRHIDRLWNVKLHIVSSSVEFIATLPNLVSIVGRQRMDPAIRFMRYSHLHVRSSKDKTDTLRQTLHQVNKMPELKCNRVINAYPTFQSLFTDFKKGQLKAGLDGKHLMTEAMESRLYKLFTCKNPNETIQ
ncbi:MMS4 (YBR098W) [Zygosaccharomyces parabailii]|nr:MMS4 (YBR098W) [Zygosaccharomyces parabailii]CDH08594.1 related to Crossover junction endonuclease MMS4 [Zygosaccharomyces bailii ISA1307]